MRWVEGVRPRNRRRRGRGRTMRCSPRSGIRLGRRARAEASCSRSPSSRLLSWGCGRPGRLHRGSSSEGRRSRVQARASRGEDRGSKREHRRPRIACLGFRRVFRRLRRNPARHPGRRPGRTETTRYLRRRRPRQSPRRVQLHSLHDHRCRSLPNPENSSGPRLALFNRLARLPRPAATTSSSRSTTSAPVISSKPCCITRPRSSVTR